jgi:hypothetical protein
MIKKEKKMTHWLKKHADTMIILGGILGAVLWMNKGINSLEVRVAVLESTMVTKQEFNELKQEVSNIKTVLIMQKIMPADLALHENVDNE